MSFSSVVGAIILLLGFYAVIWGKAHDEDTEDCGSDNLRAPFDGKTPLLQNYRVKDVESDTRK